MVTNRSSMNPLWHKTDSSHSQLGRTPHREVYSDRNLSRKESVGQKEYANHLRSSSYQILQSRQSFNGYHSRQQSNESNYSDTNKEDILSQSHNISISQSDNHCRGSVRTDANYFVQCGQTNQELDPVSQLELSVYSSSQINYPPSDHSNTNDPNLASDKFLPNSLKVQASPPPPPVRDASSLKYIRYGPGHEKFPSWPVPAGAVNQVLSPRHIHDTTIPDSSLIGFPEGCHRSHSWTEQSEFPTNTCGGYTRPYMKSQFNPNFQTQLLTVIENCEKIPPEIYHPQSEEMFYVPGDIPLESYHPENMVYFPPYDREGRPIDDKDYKIPSPPERDPGLGDSNPYQFTSAQLEEHARLYDLKYEEFPHITPFLDQLRRDSYNWDEHSERDSGRGESESVADSFRNGRESVTTVVTNSSSASSSETLKWQGSFSDISIASANSREAKKDSIVVHSAKVKTPQRHNSESVLYYETDFRESPLKLPDSINNNRNYRDTESGYVRSNKESKWIRDFEKNDNCGLKKFPSYSYPKQLFQINESPVAESGETSNISCTTSNSPPIDFSKPPSVADRINELEKQSCTAVNIEETRSPFKNELNDRILYTENRRPSFSSNNRLISSESEKSIQQSNIVHAHESFHSQPSKLTPKSKSISRKDLDDLSSSEKYEISPTENRSINSAYTYLDPNKKCMVSDSTLKNIQKQALLSFYERKTGKGLSHPNQESQSYSTSHSNNINNEKLDASNLRSDSHFQSSENMARLGKVPSDIKDAPKLKFINSAREYFDDNQTEKGANNFQINQSTRPQLLPEMSTNEVVTCLSPLLKSPLVTNCSKNNNEIDNDGEASRNYYSINHSPPTSNLQRKSENIFNSTIESSPTPPDRPPKNPNLRSNFANKCNLTDESEGQNSDYKCIQRKTYYYKKPPAPDPPSSPNDDVPHLAPQFLNIVKNQISRASTPDLPPPPPPPPDEEQTLACDEPLPPPPSEISIEGLIQDDNFNEDMVHKDQRAYHKDSYMAHRKDWTTGFEGRYRRTQSPSAPSERKIQLVKSQDHESSMNIRNLQRSGMVPKHLQSGESISMRSCMSTSNLSPICDSNPDDDVINNRLCQTSRNLAQSADWSSNNSSITVTFTADELKSLKTNKSGFQLSAFKKFNANESRHHNPRDVGGSVQSLASSSEASQSSTPSDESRYSSSWKTSLDSLNRPPYDMSDYSCNIKPISRAISIREPLHKVELQDLVNRSTNITEPLKIITGTNDIYNTCSNKSYSSPISLNNISNNGEMAISHDGPITAHPATVTEESQPSSPMSPRDNANATSTPKSSPIHSPKCSPTSPIPLNSTCYPLTPSVTSQSALHSYKDDLLMSSSHIQNALSTTLSPNSMLQKNTPTVNSSSYMKPLSPTGTSCSMAAMVVPKDQNIDRSNIVTLTYGRTPCKEEISYEKLSLEFTSCCHNKELNTILAPGKDYKKIASYITGLFSLEFRKDLISSNHAKHPDLKSENNMLLSSIRNNMNKVSALETDLANLSVSECKTRLLTKVKSSSSFPATLDAAVLTTRKESLLKSLSSKMQNLKEERDLVKSGISENDDLGLRITDVIKNRAKPAELNRYKVHVEEIEKIISLLLVLSGRLSRSENSLNYFPKSYSDMDEKILESKRDKLKEQLEEAMKLKESIDRRAIQVSKVLMQYLNEEEFAEYDHYVKMKAKLFMDSREIDEKLKLGEKQLLALKSAFL